MSPLIRLRGVNKIFRTDEVETHALADIHLDVPAGEFVVLRGPSGCGKSTLLSIMALLDSPSSGELEIEGVSVTELDDAARARLRGLSLGVVFQAFHLVPHLSVWKNVALPLEFHRSLSRAEKQERALAALARVGLSARANHYPEQLSGGQQQRVAIARALVGEPRLILADEPTGNLDSTNGDQIMGLFADAHRAGTAVCVVTHDPRYERVGTRSVHLFDGRIVDEERAAT